MLRAHPARNETFLVGVNAALQGGGDGLTTALATNLLSPLETEMPLVSAIRPPDFLGMRKKRE